MARHNQDASGELWKIAKAIIKADRKTVVDDIDITTFWDLRHVKFLWTWRDMPREDEEKRIAAARVKVLSAELRDLFGKDVQIEVCEPIWRQLTARWHRRIIKHELHHLAITFDEDAFNDTGKRVPKLDKEGRIKVRTTPHDLVLRTFIMDIEDNGLSEDEYNLIKKLLPYYRAVRKGEMQRYETPKVLIDGPETDDSGEAEDAA